MMLLMRRSFISITLSTMSCWDSWKTPASVPWAIMTLISSPVTGGSLEGLLPMMRRTVSVMKPRRETMG